MSEEVPKEVHGLITAAKLALGKVIDHLPGPIFKSHKDEARCQLATALHAIEMAKFHIYKMENE